MPEFKTGIRLPCLWIITNEYCWFKFLKATTEFLRLTANTTWKLSLTNKIFRICQKVCEICFIDDYDNYFLSKVILKILCRIYQMRWKYYAKILKKQNPIPLVIMIVQIFTIFFNIMFTVADPKFEKVGKSKKKLMVLCSVAYVKLQSVCFHGFHRLIKIFIFVRESNSSLLYWCGYVYIFSSMPNAIFEKISLPNFTDLRFLILGVKWEALFF